MTTDKTINKLIYIAIESWMINAIENDETIKIVHH
jgi:hypothetical protein